MQLPNVFDLMFESKNRQFDGLRWRLLKWVLDLDDDTVQQVRDKKNCKKFAVTILTLLYLIRVILSLQSPFEDLNKT